MKTIVIYHRADFDGIFCREIAKKFLPEAELIGWDYGDPVPKLYPDEGPVDPVQLYMLDISVDGLMDHPYLVWIDHHKSAMEKFQKTIRGFRIDGVAACRLAWFWFTAAERYQKQSGTDPDWKWFQENYPFASKLDFTDRKLEEPVAVRLAGEYDIWDKRDPNAELFQHGLRSRELTEFDWIQMLSVERPTMEELERLIDVGYKNILEPNGQAVPATVLGLLENGKVLQYSTTNQNESIIKAAGFTIQFEGLTFLACNHARYSSHLFTAGLKPEHDACFGFCWRDGKWTVSLYHAPGKEHHDLSKIAVKYGGGGHRGACGFRVEKLPFLT